MWWCNIKKKMHRDFIYTHASHIWWVSSSPTCSSVIWCQYKQQHFSSWQYWLTVSSKDMKNMKNMNVQSLSLMMLISMAYAASITISPRKARQEALLNDINAEVDKANKTVRKQQTMEASFLCLALSSPPGPGTHDAPVAQNHAP